MGKTTVGITGQSDREFRSVRGQRTYVVDNRWTDAMKENWIARLFALMETHEEFEMGVPATDEEITEAETDLGVLIPLQLKIYLKTFGNLKIGSDEIYGLGSNIPSYLSIVRETLSERKEFRPYIPVHLLPIQNDGGGNHYCLDLSSGRDDPPVVFWSHEDDEQQTPYVVSESFSSWLLDVAHGTLGL